MQFKSSSAHGYLVPTPAGHGANTFPPQALVLLHVGCYSGVPQVHGKEVGNFAVQQELEVNTYSDLVVAHLVRVCFVHLDPHQSPHLRFPPTPAADVSPSPLFHVRCLACTCSPPTEMCRR